MGNEQVLLQLQTLQFSNDILDVFFACHSDCREIQVIDSVECLSKDNVVIPWIPEMFGTFSTK